MIGVSLLIAVFIICNTYFKDYYKFLYIELSELNSIFKFFVLPSLILIYKFDIKANKYISGGASKSIRFFEDSNYYIFFERVFLAKKFTIIYFFIILVLIITTFSNCIYLTFICIPLIISINYYMDRREFIKFEKVKDSIILEFPNFITRLALLVDTGISLRPALIELSKDHDKAICHEIRKIFGLVENGQDERIAYLSFADTFDNFMIKKFVVLTLQNIYKGNENFSDNINYLKTECLKIKREMIVDRSKMAVQKMLIPNLLIFTSIMLMVLLPILINSMFERG